MAYERPTTTFHQDFAIAEAFGEAAVRDTFKRAFEGWKGNVAYFTEFVIVLNHRLWYWYEKGNQRLAVIYDELWRKADQYAYDTYKGDDLSHFLEVTD